MYKQTKHKDMTNSMTISEAIKLVSFEAGEDMTLEALNGCEITPHIFNSTIELTIDLMGITFENQNARTQFASHVSYQIARDLPTLYQIAFPKWGYDVNGNRTTDQSKWA
jgi:hypothetical protein